MFNRLLNIANKLDKLKLADSANKIEKIALEIADYKEFNFDLYEKFAEDWVSKVTTIKNIATKVDKETNRKNKHELLIRFLEKLELEQVYIKKIRYYIQSDARFSAENAKEAQAGLVSKLKKTAEDSDVFSRIKQLVTKIQGNISVARDRYKLEEWASLVQVFGAMKTNVTSLFDAIEEIKKDMRLKMQALTPPKPEVKPEVKPKVAQP